MCNCSPVYLLPLDQDEEEDADDNNEGEEEQEYVKDNADKEDQVRIQFDEKVGDRRWLIRYNFSILFLR